MRACRLPQFGDVVEYPLRDIEMQELQDGRTAGVRDPACFLSTLTESTARVLLFDGETLFVGWWCVLAPIISW